MYPELFRIGDDETAADGFMGLYVESRGLGGSMLEMDYLLRRFDAGGDTLNTLSKSTFEIYYMDMQMGKFVDDRLGTCPAGMGYWRTTGSGRAHTNNNLPR